MAFLQALTLFVNKTLTNSEVVQLVPLKSAATWIDIWLALMENVLRLIVASHVKVGFPVCNSLGTIEVHHFLTTELHIVENFTIQ